MKSALLNPAKCGRWIGGLVLGGLVWTCAGAPAAVKPGNEMLAAQQCRLLQGKRVGLLTNPSGVDSRRVSTLEVLRRAPGVKLVALFAAEHGIQGSLPAGEEFPNSVDSRTGLPVFSLYGPGPTRKPTPGMLRHVDVLVYDVQDTGCRSYTFISSMGLAMEACAEAGKEFVVLDRPNPLGGRRVEGPMLEPQYRSLVGQWEIPYVYGLTCGELAYMINTERWISKPCKLTIVRMNGWRRSMVWGDTGLPWVPTSPNIPRGHSSLYYVSTGFLGALGGVHIGIGDDYRKPFESVTAPWLDGPALAHYLNQRSRLPGVAFQSCDFRHRDKTFRGVRILFKDPANAPLLAISFHVLEAIRATAKRDLYAEAKKAGKNFSLLDKVAGTDAIRSALDAGKSAKTLTQSWNAGEETFRQRRSRYLLYPD